MKTRQRIVKTAALLGRTGRNVCAIGVLGFSFQFSPNGVCCENVNASSLPAGLDGRAVGAVLLVFWSSIEAVKGKEYQLTKRHGPWMIMVASFKTPPPERRTEGMTPEQAADQLVYELRKAGIPAYTYSQDEVRGEVETVDRLGGRLRTRDYKAQQQNYCVLAGNYESNDESTKSGKLAKDTLAWIEDRFEPEFLTVPDPNFERAGAAVQVLDSPTEKRRHLAAHARQTPPGKKPAGRGVSHAEPAAHARRSASPQAGSAADQTQLRRRPVAARTTPENTPSWSPRFMENPPKPRSA